MIGLVGAGGGIDGREPGSVVVRDTGGGITGGSSSLLGRRSGNSGIYSGVGATTDGGSAFGIGSGKIKVFDVFSPSSAVPIVDNGMAAGAAFNGMFCCGTASGLPGTNQLHANQPTNPTAAIFTNDSTDQSLADAFATGRAATALGALGRLSAKVIKSRARLAASP